ncbi:class I SAM-dependent methyltransferase [Sulfitobacter sp. JB4-11]|uniref:class I SAM-dependent methyltransferase n=1 Tax=Sulfitobacter rhodophyticola TaxID=3238304 RepID=UPI003D814B45
MTDAKFDAWSAGQSYDRYMGRWSRMIAARFLEWLDAPHGADWLEIGCGTGALTETILATASPNRIMATDASADFVGHARSAITDARASFKVVDAQNLDVEPASTDVVTSALVVNFLPDRVAALKEMQRVLKPGGILSFYVWDYPGGGIGFIDAFWKAAATLDPEAAGLNEAARFPFCTSEGLSELCGQANLTEATIAPISITTEFRDFDDFWQPFTLGAGPAPGYCMSLSPDHREALRKELQKTVGETGPIQLGARAWAVKATV